MARKNAFVDFEETGLTRQLDESLGLYNGGCKCHTKWMVYVENGEVLDYTRITDYPKMMVRMEDSWMKNSITEKNGQYFFEDKYKINEKELIPLKTYKLKKEIPKLENGTIDLWKTIHGGPFDKEELYIEEECQEVIECVNFTYDFKKEFEHLPDGVYELLIENACWASANFEGIWEGDGDVNIKIYPFVHQNEIDKFEEINPKTGNWFSEE